MRNRKSAFTLIELLVVITIIVLLLALLTPALDRAVYQAELAVCGSQLKSVGTGVLSYAVSNRRAYPVRAAIPQPSQLRANANDFRGALQKALENLNVLNCPLAGRLDFVSSTDVAIYTQNLWFSWGYNDERKKLRIGDPTRWNGQEHRLLANDRDLTLTPNQAQSAHPDYGPQTMFNEVYQDQTHRNNNALTTIAWWLNLQTAQRGRTDDNFVYDDGSVLRVDGIVSVINGNQPDERMQKMPVWANSTQLSVNSGWINVPRN